MTLPLPPREVPVDRRVDILAPKLQAALARVLAEVPDALAFETLRSNERQAFLHGFGRQYDDGRGVVTHSATALDTWHHYGLAVDIIHKTKLWGASDKWWRTLGRIGRSHGLLWGADWNNNGRSDDERFVDRPHFQWGAPMRRSPSPSAARLLAEGGYVAVWREVGAL